MKKIKEQVIIPNGKDEDIFENDYLNRKNEVKNISEIVSKLESSTVFAIDSDWGTGKTTFVRFLDIYLQRKKGIKTCFINAWENDFETDPFVLINDQIITKFEHDKKKIKKLKKLGMLILKIIKGAPSIPVASPLTKLKIKVLSLFASNLIDRVESRKKEKSTVKGFKDCLKKILKDDKLVIFVDELDRCRPSFAIETLERIKHLFDIDGVTFILSTNIEQLSHSVSGVYGQSFDGRKYLERFIDFSYQLKKPSNSDYWEALTKSEKNNVKLESLKEHGQYLASYFELTLRDINRLFFRLKLTLLADCSHINKPLILLMLFIQNDSEENYQRFCSYDSEITDELIKLLGFNLMNVPIDEGGISINDTPFEKTILEIWNILLSRKQVVYSQLDPPYGYQEFDNYLANENTKKEIDLQPLDPNPFDYDNFSEYQEVVSLFAKFYTDLGKAHAVGLDFIGVAQLD